jgi:hypothetical protein
LQLKKAEEETMTKLEREKNILVLNQAQRLALLLTISNTLIYAKVLSPALFESMLLSYHVKNEKKPRGRYAWK